ncbi:MAG: c-type cytochrome [Pirellulales bacterium]
MQFEKVFGRAPHIDDVAKAISSAFERVLITGPSPFDANEPLRKLRESLADELEDLDALKKEQPALYAKYEAAKSLAEKMPMSESAVRGRELFMGARGNCAACHVGANFTDEKYHNLGVRMDAAKPDLGRYEITKSEADKGAFKTPTVRNIARTAPYMHDGSQKDLRRSGRLVCEKGQSLPFG